MNTAHENFIAMKRFTESVDAFHTMLVSLHNEHDRIEPNTVVTALVQYAPAVIGSAWAVRKLVPFVLEEDETADIGMLAFPSAMIERFEKEGDIQGAADQRDTLDRMRVHVARRIVERRMGAVETVLERQLKASVAKNELEANRRCAIVETDRRTYPSDHVGQGQGNVVPMSTESHQRNTAARAELRDIVRGKEGA